MSEEQINLLEEKLLENIETRIVLQRHGRYDNRPPGDVVNLTAEEQATLGHLTPEGKIEARERARKRIADIFEQAKSQGLRPESVDFLLINSATYWWDSPLLGARAAETVTIIYDVLREELHDRGLGEKQILNTATREQSIGDAVQPAFKGEVSRPYSNYITEAEMFQHPEFTSFLREQAGGKQGSDFWRNFNADTFKQEREATGAEGPEEIAGYMQYFMEILTRFARRYHLRPENKDRFLVEWVVTHGDTLEPYAERVIGVEPGLFSAGYNDGYDLFVGKKGEIKTKIKDQIHNVRRQKNRDLI